MLTALLLVLSPWWSEMPVAYTARYYSEDPGAKATHYQVYVSTLDGKHHRQLTKMEVDCADVAWQGRDSLTYVILSSPNALIQLDLKTGRRKALTKAKRICQTPMRVGSLARGRAVYRINGQDLEVLSGKITRYKGRTVELEQPSLEIKSLDKANPGRLIYDSTNKIAFLESHSQRKYVATASEDFKYEAAYCTAAGHVYLVTSDREYRGRKGHTVQMVDWKLGSMRLLFGGLRIDFQPDSRYSAQLTYGDQYEGLAARPIANQMWIYDLEERRGSPVVDGPIHVTSLSVGKID